MTPPLLADAVEVDPFSGVGIPTLWIVSIIAFFVFALAALYLSFLRRAAYDDRTRLELRRGHWSSAACCRARRSSSCSTASSTLSPASPAS